MAIADSNLLFRYIDVGVNGRISDGGVWDRCNINKLLQKQSVITSEGALPVTYSIIPYYFVADEAFALSVNVMKPFPNRMLSESERIFNYRLSPARRCVECSFGVLSSRFGIFKEKLQFHRKLQFAQFSHM